MSSYTPSLKLILPASGEFNGTWGTLAVNDQITSLVDTAIAGYVDVPFTSPTVDQTLTDGNGSAANESRTMYINMTSAISAARNVIVPTASKLYYVKNSTTGGFAITVKTTAGAGISVPNGKAMVLLCNGTDVVDAVTAFSALALTTALPVTSGGTGVTTSTGTGNVVLSTSPALSNPTITAYLETAPALASSGASTSIVLSGGTVLSYTLTDNCTFTMPATTNGTSFIVKLIQDATGGRTAVFTGVKWPSGIAPTITTTASTGTDLLSFVCINSIWYGNATQAFA